MGKRGVTCPALEVLVEQGVVGNRTQARCILLQCVAYHWRNAEQTGEEPKICGDQIKECSRNRGHELYSHTVYDFLKAIAAAGAAITSQEPATRGLRTNYHPSDTELGQALYAALEAPQTCGLDIAKPAPQAE